MSSTSTTGTASRFTRSSPSPRRLAQIRDIPELTQGFELKLNPQAGTALPLVEKGPMKELFSGFDPDMTQWTDGEVISHILSTITSEGARNVGIFASEVRNVLFLVKLVNRYCPDAQIFLLNNDLLFNYRMFARFLWRRHRLVVTRLTRGPRS